MDRIKILSETEIKRRAKLRKVHLGVKGAKRSDAQRAGDDKKAEKLRDIPRKPEHIAKFRKGRLDKLGQVTNNNPRDTPEYHQFIHDVRVVLDPPCAHCGKLESIYKAEQRKKGKKHFLGMEVHHTYPAKDFEEFLMDVSKAEVLCNSCHMKADAQLRKDKKNKTGIYTNYRRKIIR